MSLRIAFGAALQFLRVRRQVSQADIAKSREQSFVSKLEAGASGVTLDAIQDLADALQLDPMAFLTVVYAADRSHSPREVLNQLQVALESSGLLDTVIPQQPTKMPHPVAAGAAVLKKKIEALMEEGVSQADVARKLGISRQTVSRHIRNK